MALQTQLVALSSQLTQLRLRTARFRPVALHLHSPDSHDWPKRASNAERNHPSRFLCEDGASAFADELRPHVHLAAITDHMKCGFASRVSRHVGNDEKCLE